MIKNVFPEFEGNNWAKNACGIVSSKALSGCLVEYQFKGYAAQHSWASLNQNLTALNINC
jgi:hypothetical protein